MGSTPGSPHNDVKTGFTLLELSIVVMIIGILVGGVMFGMTLVRQARISRVMTDIQKFLTAVQMFQNQYKALPGDMSNATKYWGAAGTPTNTWAGCFSIVSTGTQTCDGNGDGQISLGSGYGYSEQYHFWQHLALAGLIEGSYNGASGFSGLPTDLPGVNNPKGPWPGTDYGIYYLGNNTAAASPYTAAAPLNFGNALMFGSAYVGGAWSQNPALTPSEMRGIDQKYDDGLPFSGIISVGLGLGWGSGACATSPYTAASTYNLTYPGPACSINYVTGF
jgi:prepilin-type N-terminal cleavage/methylation domain-containing protein